MMKKFCLYFYVCAFLLAGKVQAQYLPSNVASKLKKHLEYLASDELQGRFPGTAGEKKAADYIAGQFKKAKLLPISKTDGYFQYFNFTAGLTYSPNNTLSIGNINMARDTAYYPLASSGNGKVEGQVISVGKGIHAPEAGYSDYAEKINRTGMIFHIEMGLPEGVDLHSATGMKSDIDSRIRAAIEQGAAGIVFTLPAGSHDYPHFELTPKIQPYGIPMVCLITPGASIKEGVAVKMQVEIVKMETSAINVAGWIDNRAANTVIIGAHYDHLGMGAEGSLYRGEPSIHNGADDNASGTALLLEIAHYLSKSGPKNNNYLLVAFSGEEEGLLGSKYFVGSEVYKAFQANYMLNMDMVGRLDTTDKTLIINGVGTSDAWNQALQKATPPGLLLKTTEGGIGPSDQTSFYLAGIPAIHFFSGTHSDYHKPSDDADKINYPAMDLIGNMLLGVVHALDTEGKLTYIKTKDDNAGKSTSFKVTLGIIPDYAWSGEGVKIDGVSDGKPASKAGLQAGDTVLELGDIPVKDIYVYMEALGKFTKGQTVKLVYLRDGEKQEVEITF